MLKGEEMKAYKTEGNQGEGAREKGEEEGEGLGQREDA
jgi:hypothetical protein